MLDKNLVGVGCVGGGQDGVVAVSGYLQKKSLKAGSAAVFGWALRVAPCLLAIAGAPALYAELPVETPALSPVDSDTATPPEPEITIKQQGHATVQEYRLNHRLYMMKVTPAKGIPYYLVDTDGDGTFDTKSAELRSTGWVPQWVLIKWK